MQFMQAMSYPNQGSSCLGWGCLHPWGSSSILTTFLHYLVRQATGLHDYLQSISATQLVISYPLVLSLSSPDLITSLPNPPIRLDRPLKPGLNCRTILANKELPKSKSPVPV